MLQWILTPNLTITNNNTTICSGDMVNIVLNSTTTGHQINVSAISYGLVTGGGVMVGDSFVDGNSITEALSNTTNDPIVVSYTFNVTTPLTTPICPLVPVNQVVNVTVDPQPMMSITNNAAEICSGSSTDIDLFSTTTGAVITLDGITGGAGITGFSPIGLTFVNGDNISDALSNITDNPITATYEFSVSVSGCDDLVGAFTTNVLATVTVPPVTAP